MIKLLDRYIIKKFLGTFLFMIGAFVVVAIIVDFSENVDDFVKSSAGAWQIIVDYYVNFAFYFGNLLSSFIIFLTIIWFTSKLAQKTEIVAILSGGISYNRFLRPYFIAASVLVATSLLLSHYVVPHANKTKYDFEINYLKAALTVDENNMHREIEPGTIAFFYRVMPENQSGSNFSLERWQNGKLVWKLNSTGATFHPQENYWTITNAQIRTIHSDSTESVIYRAKMDTTLNMTIDDFGLRKEVMHTMDFWDLQDFISELKASGSKRAVEFEVEHYTRTANAFAIFVLTLIGVSISSRKQRGGTGVHLMLGIIIGFIYVFIARIMAVSAMTIGFPPYLAVWVPNIVFSFVGLFFYLRAQK